MFYFSRGRLWSQKGQYQAAIDDLNAAIKLQPKHAVLYAERASAYEKMRLYDKAVADYTEAIRRKPGDGMLYSFRAYTLMKDYERDRAIDDYSMAIQLTPDNALNYSFRGRLLQQRKQFKRALEDFGEAVRRKPDDWTYHYDLAWLLATCPDSRIRDGKRALTEATRACTLTKWKSAPCLEALAAAAAETSDFEQAVKRQSQALALLPKHSVDYQDCERRLSLDEIKVPCRD